METQNKTITNLYLQGESMAEIGRILGIHPQTVKRRLVECKVPIRTRKEQNRITNQKRKKQVQEDYFSNIDNVNKAWILGFMAADGAINKRDNEMKIALSTRDREILEKIRNEMSIEREIKDSETNNGFLISTLQWSSEQQKKDLAKFGIVNNKSYLPMHLPVLADNLVLAFILGFFDGDGSISVSKNNYLRFRLCAYRQEILQDIASFLEKKYSAKYSLNKGQRDIYELSISTTYSERIFEDMYSLGSLRLDRKYQKFLEYKNCTRPQHLRNRDEELC